MNPAALQELRIETRSNIFAMATIYAVGGSYPVRVRNISRAGALVEGASLPSPETPIRLSRGSLSVGGEIMWSSDGKAGLRFAAPVVVADWLPQGKRGSGQQLIDEIVHRARVDGLSRPKGATVEIADEMVQLRQMLERAGEELAFDPAVSTHHGPALQMIDAVVQGLGKLALNAAASLPPSVRLGG